MNTRSRFRVRLLAVVVITLVIAAVFVIRRSLAPGSTTPSKVVASNGSVQDRPDQAAFEAALLPEERKLDENMVEQIRPHYARGWYVLRHPTADATVLEPLLSLADRAEPNPPRTALKTLENPQDPEHAGFALAVLAQMWYVKGPIPALQDRMTDLAIRFADCPVSDGVRSSCATCLRVMSEYPSQKALSANGEKALNRLLENDFIKKQSDRQIQHFADAKAATDNTK